MKRTLLRSFGIWFLVLSATSIVFLSARYLGLEVTGILETKPKELLASNIYYGLFITHVLGGMIALMSAPFQLFKKRRFHKAVGRVYLTAVLLSGVAGFCVAFFAYGGLVAQLGLGALSLVWLSTAAWGLRCILSGNIVAHKRWMSRSIAITFSALSFRICLLAIPAMGFSFLVAYQVASWIWIANVALIEVYLASPSQGGKFTMWHRAITILPWAYRTRLKQGQ